MLKIRRPLGRLIFNMGIAIPGKTVFLIETAPCFQSSGSQAVSCSDGCHVPQGTCAVGTDTGARPFWGYMMTSSNGDIFHDTAPFCGEFTVTGEFPHKDQSRGALMFSWICGWISGWVNHRDAGDLRRHRTHYYVTVMILPELFALNGVCTLAIQLGDCRWPAGWHRWSTMHLPHIPQCTIQNRNVHIFVLNGASWDKGQVHCGICAFQRILLHQTSTPTIYTSPYSLMLTLIDPMLSSMTLMLWGHSPGDTVRWTCRGMPPDHVTTGHHEPILCSCWCHDMETLSVLLSLCEGNLTGGCSLQMASDAELWCFLYC